MRRKKCAPELIYSRDDAIHASLCEGCCSSGSVAIPRRDASGPPRIGRVGADAADAGENYDAELLWVCVISRQCFDGCELAGRPSPAEE
jgi:hypothetical protein